MTTEEKRYRVTAQLVSIHQIVVQGRDEDEARDFANSIDFEKWTYVEGEYVIVDIAKDFFERKLKVEQDTELLPSTDGPYLKIVKVEITWGVWIYRPSELLGQWVWAKVEELSKVKRWYVIIYLLGLLA